MNTKLLYLSFLLNPITLFATHQQTKPLQTEINAAQRLEKLTQTINSIKDSIAMYEQAKERNDSLNLCIITTYNGSTSSEQIISNLYHHLSYFEAQLKKLQRQIVSNN